MLLRTAKKKNEKDFMLIAVYYVLILITTLVNPYFWNVCSELTSNNTFMDGRKSFFAAEAGLDRMIANLNTSNTDNIGWTEFEDGSFRVSYDATTETIISDGRCGNMATTITATVTKQKKFDPRGAFIVHGGFSSSSSLNLLFDGNNYDANGVLTGESGVYGISVANSSYFVPGKLIAS